MSSKITVPWTSVTQIWQTVKVANRVSAFLTGKTMKEPECILVKDLTYSVCLNHCSMSLS